MRDAASHRAQAELYRQIARILSSPDDAEVALTAAARHMDRAKQMERYRDRALAPAKLGN